VQQPYALVVTVSLSVSDQTPVHQAFGLSVRLSGSADAEHLAQSLTDICKGEIAHLQDVREAAGTKVEEHEDP